MTWTRSYGRRLCQGARGHPSPLYCRVEDVAYATERALQQEANVFTAELLMPEETVRAKFRRSPSAAELASRFGVSEEAMHWRLYSFGLVADSLKPRSGTP
jgi:Zn-dependent peptidase ImmA (M78 family)